MQNGKQPAPLGGLSLVTERVRVNGKAQSVISPQRVMRHMRSLNRQELEVVLTLACLHQIERGAQLQAA